MEFGIIDPVSEWKEDESISNCFNPPIACLPFRFRVNFTLQDAIRLVSWVFELAANSQRIFCFSFSLLTTQFSGIDAWTATGSMPSLNIFRPSIRMMCVCSKRRLYSAVLLNMPLPFDIYTVADRIS